jgi:hypothetical protein
MNRKELTVDFYTCLKWCIMGFFFCRLGGVVITVLATGPKVTGSNPAKAMDF